MFKFNSRFLLFVLSSFFFSRLVFAAPTGENLLKACEQALSAGFTGAEGMACTWYVTPCDCDYRGDADVARVCLPPEPDVESLAREVIAGLIALPGLQEKSATFAAGAILSRYYPCIDE